MVAGALSPREQAERLVRGVNGLLDKTPTISVPSAREVLRTRVGDCNEHTALYVALARAVGIPTRINVGLAWVLGAFYYHAWPEVYLEEPDGRGLWLPVDPTFNQFPADATHVRLLRGGPRSPGRHPAAHRQGQARGARRGTVAGRGGADRDAAAASRPPGR